MNTSRNPPRKLIRDVSRRRRSVSCAHCVAPAGNPPVNTFDQVSTTKAGWTVGGGAEWKLAPNWSVKAEYLYVDLGTDSSTVFYTYDISRPPGPFTSSIAASVRDRENIVRAGINYMFGGPVYNAY